MSSVRLMKWITGGLEGVLAIPVLGGLIVISMGYVPLGLMLILHIVTLVLCIKSQAPKYGSILGIVTSLLAWIPFLGWIMHVVTAILLMVDAAKKEAVIEITNNQAGTPS
ncbi:hypothetical protein [Salinithrix halophila]|uniref:DUF4233 domain-containing protein n=1 Tax=Salinithrix halophila TaxID=1485204 RepID=A0ABV8JBN4_9BACL